MTMRPTFDSRATASMAVSTSLASCMADEGNRTPNDGAVASITRKRPGSNAVQWQLPVAVASVACPR